MSDKPQDRATEGEAYSVAILLLVVGAAVAGLGLLGLTGTEGEDDGIPMPVAYVLFGVGGVLAQVGIIALGVIVGTSHLRR